MTYQAQTFSVGQVLTAAQVNQIESNIKGHRHGIDAGVTNELGEQLTFGNSIYLFGSVTSGTYQYSTRYAETHKLGNRVDLSIDLRVSSITAAGAGGISIAGIPYSTSSISIVHPLAALTTLMAPVSGYTQVVGTVGPGTVVNLWAQNFTGSLGGTQFPITSIVSGSRILLNGTYFTNS